MNEYSDLLKELEDELKFEARVLTRDQCHGSLTRHNALYERAKSILENWHELEVDKLINENIELNRPRKIKEAIEKLLAQGYKECSIDFTQGIIKAGIDMGVHDFEEYLKRYQIPKDSVFYYRERGNYCDVVTFGIGMHGVDNGYINGSAYIDKCFIKTVN